MKLELKHIAPYLPYKLKCVRGKEVFILNGLRDWIGWSGYFDDKHGSTAVPISVIKPVLRPMSDLVKPITINKHNFIPIMKLWGLCNEGYDLNLLDEKEDTYLNIKIGQYLDVIWNKASDNNPYTEHQFLYNYSHNCFNHRKYDFACNSIEELGVTNQLHLFNNLYEWSFDVSGLIDAGLAIDINTIQETV